MFILRNEIAKKGVARGMKRAYLGQKGVGRRGPVRGWNIFVGGP